MSTRNLRFTMTRGETGKVLWFKFEPTDQNGVAAPVDLTDWVITVRVTQDATVFINNAEAFAMPNQVTNKGEGTFTFSALQADLPAGEYRLRIKGVDNAANVYYFPTLPNRTYATLQVLAQ